MLPVAPVGYGDSPYSAESAFAGNPLFIDLDARSLGASKETIAPPPAFAEDEVDFERVHRHRSGALSRAFVGFVADGGERSPAFVGFTERNADWLPDYALYAALKRAHGLRAWTTWPEALRAREPAALERARQEHAPRIRFETFVQFVWDEQWRELEAYAHERGVGLLGDLPIFVAHDSADVWQHQRLFRLEPDGNPTVVSGVPPDYFSATGQRWGNPLYRWKRLERSKYAWWVRRFEVALGRFDAVRLDHFIGFTRYWEIPASEPTAIHGRWMEGPGKRLFDAVKAKLRPGAKRGGPSLPLVAEDLGLVTPRVTKLRDDLGLPGIRLLQFAFGTDPQAPTFLPHAHARRSVVYTGTHDNDTTVGWFHDEGGKDSTRTSDEAANERIKALAYMGTGGEEIHWDMIRLALSSVAETVVVPMQDILGLGSEARMNRPGKAEGNWRWRVRQGALTDDVALRLRALTTIYGRGTPVRG